MFDMALLDSTLVQAALRALALALVVGAGLTLLRVRNPHYQLTAWTAVLASALAMPLLMAWMVVTVPAEEIVVPAGTIAEPLTVLAADAATGAAASEPRIDGTLETASAWDWATIAIVLYVGVAGVLLLRLAIGLVLTARLRAAAERLCAPWTGDADIRISRAISAPVTVGSTILLPADFEGWSGEKRQAVLLHERAHVTRGDFYVQILAALHRAVFWFSPLAWWLHDRLAELAEDASDAEAAAGLAYRADYAAVLLDFAQMPAAPRLKFAPIGVAMARPATVRRRIERVLEKKLPQAVSRGARAATAGIVIVAACAVAVSIVRMPAAAATGIKEAPLPAAAPVAAARPDPAPAAALVAPPVSPVPPAVFDTHGHHVWVPPIHVEVPPVRVDIPGEFEMAAADRSEFDAEMEELRRAVAEAKASGDNISVRVAEQLEAAAERAQAQMERAQQRAQERAAERAERARRTQLAAAEAPGPVTKESRTVGDFTGVSFGGSGKVFITVGPKASLVLEADAQTLSRTRTEVDAGGVLRIRRRGDDDWGHRGDVTAYVTVPELKLARVSGSGDLKVAGLNGGKTDLSISGSGNVEADGKVDKLGVSISGSGSAKMEKLVVGDAQVAISGSGSAVLDVRDSLDVRVSGSGSVRYLSQPKDIDTSISGSGSVRRRDAT
ncbi:MAG: DUF2807 domain-containing protein [Rhodospirillaceae bacterium]